VTLAERKGDKNAVQRAKDLLLTSMLVLEAYKTNPQIKVSAIPTGPVYTTCC
jgi:hypothetical protein